jgi:hypothetical protein
MIPHRTVRSPNINSGRLASPSTRPGAWAGLALVLVLAGASYAQIDTAWTFTYAGAAGTNYEPLAFLVDSTSAARNVYVAGWAEQSSGEIDALLLKIDSSGHYVWAETYPNMTASGAAMDASGNIYIAGVERGTAANRGICILKYAPNGVMSWSKTYSEQGLDFMSVGTIAIDSLHVYACGRADSAVRIIKYSLTGPSTPDSVIGYNSAMPMWGQGQFHILRGGGAYLAITRERPNDNYHWLIVKLSSQGQVLWERTYRDTDSSFEWINWSQVDDRGSIYLTGTATRITKAASSFRTMKMDSLGDTLWTRTYNAPESLRDRPRFLIVDRGNVYVAGWSQHVYMGMNGSTALVKYDSLGNQQWASRFGSEDDSDADIGYEDRDEEPRPSFYPPMKADDSGDVCLTGECQSAVVTDAVAVLLKYSPQGNLVSVRRIRSSADVWSGAIVEMAGALYQVGRTARSIGDYRGLGIFVAKYLGR